MRRTPRIAAAALAMLLSSCGGSSSPAATAAPNASAAADTTAGAAAETGQPSAAGNVTAPKIADATYASGTAHVEVTGDKQLTVDGQLVVGVSVSTGGTTVITYQGGTGNDTVAFAISNNPDTPDAGLTFSLSTTTWVTGGDGTTGCHIELTRNDASGVAGQFTCRGVQVIAGSGVATADVTATFSAST